MRRPAVKVLVADDHALVRAGICSLLSKMRSVAVVGEASNGRETCRRVDELKPDVVLMDLAMPELNGIEAARHVMAHHAETRVIIFSMYSTEEHVLQALHVGAAGYLLKNAMASDLADAVDTVIAGRTYLSPTLSREALSEYSRRTGFASPLDRLTVRQREILQLIAEGRNTKEIAGALEVSAKTVETHRAMLMRRLGIHDVPGLVRFAVRTGLVTVEG